MQCYQQRFSPIQGTNFDLTRMDLHTRLQPYQLRKEELNVHDGCVLLGSQVVIPEALKSRMLEQLHQGHPGITRMKALTRSFVWWP